MSDLRNDPPFHAVVSPPAESMDAGEFSGADDDGWTLAALEEAYQRAVESAENAETLIEQSAPLLHSVEETAPIGDVAAATPESAPQSTASISDPASRLDPEHVLEALLFVGGEPLTGRRLADLLGGEHMYGQIDELIVGVNTRYVEQCRPYQIVLGGGGYRLALRPEFEAVRNRVYGLGPRDVRLSQDALEVLALVAYQQPVSRAALEATGKANVAPLVRQLLRLELIELERGEGGKDDVRYRTTNRFLQLFALERLEDLPQPEDLIFR